MESEHLTPKDLAAAIGTSESSVRRWLDAGDVKVIRTAGGHRRIPLPEAMRFIRETGASVVRPEILGLKGVRNRLTALRQAAGSDELFEALREGRADVARGLLTSWYLAGRSPAEIFDKPVRIAMARIGEIWKHRPVGILQEHHGTQACVEAIIQLRDLLPPPPAAAPVAVGGAPEGDFYAIPTLMAATILRAAGYRSTNYGPNTPLLLLADAACEQRARMVWVSITADLNRPLGSELESLARALVDRGIELVIGGRFGGAPAPVAGNVRSMASMAELAAFAEATRG